MDWSNADWSIVNWTDIDGNHYDLTKGDREPEDFDEDQIDWITVGFRDSEGADEESWEYEDYTTFAGPFVDFEDFYDHVESYMDNEGAS